MRCDCAHSVRLMQTTIHRSLGNHHVGRAHISAEPEYWEHDVATTVSSISSLAFSSGIVSREHHTGAVFRNNFAAQYFLAFMLCSEKRLGNSAPI